MGAIGKSMEGDDGGVIKGDDSGFGKELDCGWMPRRGRIWLWDGKRESGPLGEQLQHRDVERWTLEEVGVGR